jgi:hypothetical protein
MTRLLRALITLLLCASFSRMPSAVAAVDDVDFSGTWLMVQLTTTVSRVPILGNIYAQTRVISVHELRHEGERLYGPGRLCRLELDSGTRFVRAGFSERTKAHLPLPMVDARLSEASSGEVKLWQPSRPSVVGARLEDPQRDPLPTRPEAPEVVDEDRDGHPGLTIEVSGLASGQVYVVQRSWTELRGHLVSADAFAGKLRFRNEQVVLDATSRRLRRTPETSPDPSRSWFRLQRLPEDTTCEAALPLAESWFP